MARKRELVVEKWQSLAARQPELDAEDILAMLVRSSDDAREELAFDLVSIAYERQIAMAWADCGMQVYDFDPSFAASIAGEKWIDLLPECIGYRPHDCFYMKLPCGNRSEGTVIYVVPCDNILGFDPSLFPGCEEGPGVYFGGDPRSADGANGRTLVNTGDELLSICRFAIPSDIGYMADDTELELYPASLAANGVAYLCSANADIVASYSPPKVKRRNNAKRRSQATWHDVGYRIGAELRSYEHAKSERKPYQGGTVRPHMRRAHWHHYWTGPRDGDRQLVLRWIPPVMVNVKAEGIGSATLHKVC